MLTFFFLQHMLRSFCWSLPRWEVSVETSNQQLPYPKKIWNSSRQMTGVLRSLLFPKVPPTISSQETLLTPPACLGNLYENECLEYSCPFGISASFQWSFCYFSDLFRGDVLYLFPNPLKTGGLFFWDQRGQPHLSLKEAFSNWITRFFFGGYKKTA